ncbi:hypothetical protein VFPBJ_02272 [Purpureocillium lilacinum]|uniref:Uncharacterized protein n=1 Tax=Purpureocillium lilacinum TaxID=33203 RepID=A0A179H027_PURLI|nr:hypothetical protein VFPBJ_02272 [Purpureocillium lilacinum]
MYVMGVAVRFGLRRQRQQRRQDREDSKSLGPLEPWIGTSASSNQTAASRIDAALGSGRSGVQYSCFAHHRVGPGVDDGWTGMPCHAMVRHLRECERMPATPLSSIRDEPSRCCRMCVLCICILLHCKKYTVLCAKVECRNNALMKHSEVDGTTRMRTLAQVDHQCSSSSSLLHIPGASRGVISSVHGGGPAPSGNLVLNCQLRLLGRASFCLSPASLSSLPKHRTKASLRITTGLSLVRVKPAVHSPRGHGRHFGKPTQVDDEDDDDADGGLASYKGHSPYPKLLTHAQRAALASRVASRRCRSIHQRLAVLVLGPVRRCRCPFGTRSSSRPASLTQRHRGGGLRRVSGGLHWGAIPLSVEWSERLPARQGSVRRVTGLARQRHVWTAVTSCAWCVVLVGSTSVPDLRSFAAAAPRHHHHRRQSLARSCHIRITASFFPLNPGQRRMAT